MSRRIGFLCILTSALALAWAYWAGGVPAAAAALVAFGSLWLVAEWRRWAWFSGAGLAASAAAAAGGLWLGLPAGWMIAGALGGLLAWDLSGFNDRLRLVKPTGDTASLERRHLAWSGAIGGMGLVSFAAASAFRLQFSFAWIALLALGGVLGLVWLVSRLFGAERPGKP